MQYFLSLHECREINNWNVYAALFQVLRGRGGGKSASDMASYDYILNAQCKQLKHLTGTKEGKNL